MDVHQCEQFCNNMRLMHERAVRRITKYLARTSTHMDLPDGNRWLYTCRVVYNPDKEKCIECYVDSNFAGG